LFSLFGGVATWTVFFEVTAQAVGGRRRLILLLEGREGRGWSRFSRELSKVMAFFEAMRGSNFSSASSLVSVSPELSAMGYSVEEKDGSGRAASSARLGDPLGLLREARVLVGRMPRPQICLCRRPSSSRRPLVLTSSILEQVRTNDSTGPFVFLPNARIVAQNTPESFLSQRQLCRVSFGKCRCRWSLRPVFSGRGFLLGCFSGWVFWFFQGDLIYLCRGDS
jgi:hypothetical protein